MNKKDLERDLSQTLQTLPRRKKETSRIVSFRLTNTDYKYLKELAKKNKVGLSRIIEWFFVNYLKNLK
jgi:hypothetical protein